MVTFESGGEGVQVAGELSAFAGSSTNPMAGTASVSRAQAGVGDFALVLGRQGLAEVVSTSRRADSDLPLLVNPHAVLFPRLPAGELAVGDSWTDTVTTYLGGTDAEKVVVLHVHPRRRCQRGWPGPPQDHGFRCRYHNEPLR